MYLSRGQLREMKKEDWKVIDALKTASEKDELDNDIVIDMGESIEVCEQRRICAGLSEQNYDTRITDDGKIFILKVRPPMSTTELFLILTVLIIIMAFGNLLGSHISCYVSRCDKSTTFCHFIKWIMYNTD